MSEERKILNWENDEKADALDKTRWAHDFEWSELEILAGYMLAIEFSEGAVFFVSESQEVSWPFSSMGKHRSSRKAVTT